MVSSVRALWPWPGKNSGSGGAGWSSDLEAIIRKLTIQGYQAQIALRDRVSESLSKEFERQNLTIGQKAEVARQWDHALKEKYAFQLMLNQLGRRWHEELPITEPSATSL